MNKANSMPWNYVDKEILRSNIFLFPTYFQIKLFYWARNPSTIHWIVALQDMVWKLDQDPETRDLGTLGSGTRDPPPPLKVQKCDLDPPKV